ncbi:Glutathione transport system permease protein GsiD [Rhodovastum atsumiense]|uniref:ABC transporter permease n=1 Tax=Rhodovastum atsumiense TaxID=504468 RepID=A0A5M6IYQ5_9PROT|nr:ABC transporter permease [Rhodovastum atsumiense]KAA5613452.1 ABC transporter permease [Rhodovastum atsumiense]CAH2603187.1 Glutathione transport system permease protein GsiD [Rhodovastum atsumiense]
MSLAMVTSSPRAPVRRSGLRRVLRWLRDDLRASIALLYLALLVALSLLAPWVAPHSPVVQSLDMLMPPDATHWLGTDDLGRDVFSRLIYGAPMTLYASFLAVSVGAAIGLPVGILAGWLGGWVDALTSRFIDALLSFPSIVLAIAVTGALGIGLTNSMIAVGIVFSPGIARLIRVQTIIVRDELYVDAARCFGMAPWRLVLRHVLPNAIQPCIVQVTLMLATALLSEASLSFLGLGVQPPQPSWGQMLARSYTYMEIAPEQMYAPGLAILFTALAFNALGESLRAVLDPTRRHR